MKDYPSDLEKVFFNQHASDLQRSYHALFGTPLLDAYATETSPSIIDLYNAPFALLSHGAEADPIFNFGNQRALELFAYSWEAFTALPSRLSAEPLTREERQR